MLNYQSTPSEPPPPKPDFGQLYARFYASVLRRLLDLTKQDRTLAEDLTQTAFEKALRAYPAFDGRKPHTWLLVIATNVFRDHYRHVTTVKVISETRIESRLDGKNGGWQADFQHPGVSTNGAKLTALVIWDRPQTAYVGHDQDSREASDPAELYEREETRRVVRDALDGMRGDYRAALLLEAEGLTYDEVGEWMGRTRPAVKSLLYRARNQLAAALGVERALRAGGPRSMVTA